VAGKGSLVGGVEDGEKCRVRIQLARSSVLKT